MRKRDSSRRRFAKNLNMHTAHIYIHIFFFATIVISILLPFSAPSLFLPCWLVVISFPPILCYITLWNFTASWRISRPRATVILVPINVDRSWYSIDENCRVRTNVQPPILLRKLFAPRSTSRIVNAVKWEKESERYIPTTFSLIK